MSVLWKKCAGESASRFTLKNTSPPSVQGGKAEDWGAASAPSSDVSFSYWNEPRIVLSFTTWRTTSTRRAEGTGRMVVNPAGSGSRFSAIAGAVTASAAASQKAGG